MLDDVPAGLPIQLFADANAFERWLTAYGASEPGLWLKLAKKGAPEPTLSKSEAVDIALCYGWIDGQINRFDDYYWLTRFTPRRPRSMWSEINRVRATTLLDEGRMRQAGLAQVEAAKADGRWVRAYAPASTAEVPPDLAQALAANPRAAAFFATVTGSNRYAILHRIGTVKKPETRARKVAGIVAMLERGETIYG